MPQRVLLDTTLATIRKVLCVEPYERLHNLYVVHTPCGIDVGVVKSFTEYGKEFIVSLRTASHAVITRGMDPADYKRAPTIHTDDGYDRFRWSAPRTLKDFVCALGHRVDHVAVGEHGVTVRVHHPYLRNVDSPITCWYDYAVLELNIIQDYPRYEWACTSSNFSEAYAVNGLARVNGKPEDDVFAIARGCFEQKVYAPLFDYVQEKYGLVITERKGATVTCQ